MFDINKAITDSRLSKAETIRLQREIKKDYPNDPMLYELHMIRALKMESKKEICLKARGGFKEAARIKRFGASIALPP